MTKQVVIIGAGVIGLSAALECRRRGFEVTIIDRRRGRWGWLLVRQRGDRGPQPLRSPGRSGHGPARIEVDGRSPIAVLRQAPALVGVALVGPAVLAGLLAAADRARGAAAPRVAFGQSRTPWAMGGRRARRLRFRPAWLVDALPDEPCTRRRDAHRRIRPAARPAGRSARRGGSGGAASREFGPTCRAECSIRGIAIFRPRRLMAALQAHLTQRRLPIRLADGGERLSDVGQSACSASARRRESFPRTRLCWPGAFGRRR